MMEGDVRKKGMLYQQQQRFGKKWKKVWAEAIADSTHSVSCLELFEFSKSSMKDSKKRAEGKKMIMMRDCVKIAERGVDGCPKECSTFQLETAEKMHMFASPTSELQSWIMELCKLAFPLNQVDCRSQKQDHHQPIEMHDNTLYSTTESVRDFLAIAVATEAAVRCKLYGEYFLTPQNDSLLLKDYKTKQVLLTWPYRFIRKFGQDMLAFNFEAGRRCESGEGYFEFATTYSDHLFTVISNALKKLPKVENAGTRLKEPQITQNPKQSQIPPAQMKHPKKLTTSLSLNSISLSDNRSKDKKVKSTNSTPVPSIDVQDPVYAMISRPVSHVKSNKDYKNKQLGPHPDFVAISEDISGVLEDGDQMSSEQFAIHTKFKNRESESVYSEVKNYDDRGGWESVDHVEHCAYSYEPHLSNLNICSDLKGMREEEQLDMSMEQLAIHHPPDVYGAESMYSQVMSHYNDCGDIEESVDNVEEYFYPLCASDAHFKMCPSNLEDSQDEGFSTYDNLPRRV